MSDNFEYSLTDEFDRQKFVDLALQSYELDNESLITDVDFGEPEIKIKKWFEHGFLIRVAKTTEGYIGYMLTREYQDGDQSAMSLEIIWVHPDYRGNSIATNFFNELENIARNNQNLFITGNCHISRITFFESLGCDINMDFGNNFKPFRKAL